MSEYELIDIFTETVSRTWMLVNMWMGISFGYMAIANFGAHILNVTKIVALSILYISFSLLILRLMALNGVALDGYHADLRAMESHVTLSTGTAALLDARENLWGGRVLLIFCFFSTFICALAYMPYSYWASKRENT